MIERLSDELCPSGCGCGRYGNNPEAPVGYDCGSGYMTDENLPEEFVESVACGIIKNLRTRLHKYEWNRVPCPQCGFQRKVHEL